MYCLQAALHEEYEKSHQLFLEVPKRFVQMGQTVQCTAQQRIQTQTLQRDGPSKRKTAEMVGCSRKMVENALHYRMTKETCGPMQKNHLRLINQSLL